MTVFKGFMVLIKRNLNILVMYLAIFLVICFAIQAATGGEGMAHFEEEKLNIAVIDRDGGTLAKGLTEYLGERHNLVDVADDKDVIQEEMFYRNLYYVVTIPEGFEASGLAEGEKLKTTKLPGTNSAFYVDQQINTFLNDVKTLTGAGFGLEESIQDVKEAGTTETKVTLIDKNGHGGRQAHHAFMFQYMPYIIMAIVCYTVGFIMIAYRKKDVRRRMLCSAVPSRKQNAQLLLGFAVVGVGTWAICILLAVVMYGKAFLSDNNLIYYLMNSFVLMLVALAIAFVIGVLVQKEEIINSVVNIVTLGMSFTCGVFVQLSVLGKGVRMAARFLPVYWYEVNNGIIADNRDFSAIQQTEIYQGFGIQLLFAAAILCVGLVISKYREQE